MSEVIVALKELQAHEAKHGGIRTLKTKLAKIQADVQRLQAELVAEGERLKKVKGLPIEFWNETRVQAARLIISIGEMMRTENPSSFDSSALDVLKQLAALYEEFGAGQVVEMTARNRSQEGDDAMIERIRKAAGDGAREIHFADPEVMGAVCIVVAPVPDFEKFVSSLESTVVIDEYPERRELDLEVYSPPGAYSAAEPQPLETEVASEPHPEFQAGMAHMDAELDRNAKEQGASPEQVESFRAAMRRGLAGVAAGDLDSEPSRFDPPTDIEDFAELLADEHAPHHDEAVRKLLSMTPADVKDKKLRGKIARGFRELALGSHFDRDDAVRGLVIWGGKYSVPIIVQLLDEDRPGPQEAIFRALGDVPTAEGAAAATRHLGNFFNHDLAVAALRRMGPVAEDALIQAAPADNEDVSLAAVALLADVGTDKSLAILRKATRSRNYAVKEAAYASIRAIRTRQEKADR
jgi:hypothetical protein